MTLRSARSVPTTQLNHECPSSDNLHVHKGIWATPYERRPQNRQKARYALEHTWPFHLFLVFMPVALTKKSPCIHVPSITQPLISRWAVYTKCSWSVTVTVSFQGWANVDLVYVMLTVASIVSLRRATFLVHARPISLSATCSLLKSPHIVHVQRTWNVNRISSQA